RSRIYLGVHWSFDANDGLIAGRALGQYVARNALQRNKAVNPNIIAEADPPELGLRAKVGAKGATIELDQPVAGRARVTLLDLQGRKVAEFSDGTHSAGTWSVSWNGRDARGPLASGVFFVLAETAGERRT